jgi:hypothetical protein
MQSDCFWLYYVDRLSVLKAMVVVELF